MTSLEGLVVQYGYLALFVGTFLEGETILIIAGYLAQEGLLDLPWVIVSAFLGTFAGDQTFFFLGRRKGVGFLAKRPAWQRNTERAFALLERYQVGVILGFRFLYGIRNVTPFVIGSSGLHPARFFVLNFLGAATWAVAFGCVGYYLGAFAETALRDLKKYEMVGLGAFCAAALLYFLWSNLRKK